MSKWTYLFVTVICIVCMFGFPAGAPPSIARAQGMGDNKIYMPFASFVEPIRFDDFEDGDPAWQYRLLKDPTDGFFEHLNGKYAAHVQDNAALMISSPGWRPRGDFKLEVDGRHLGPDNKTFNGLGLAFSADDEWTGFYSMIIAAGSAQHFWAIVRYEKKTNGRYKADMLTNDGYRGGPGSMKNHSGTNRLMIVRIGDTITPYCNGKALPPGDAQRYVIDSRYGANRLVGVIVTSYEFDEGEMDFDNFELTPLYGEDPDTYLPQGAENATYEFDTPPLQLP